MSDAFDADELWFAHLLASVPTPGSLERPAARPARARSRGRRRYRTLAMAGGLALLVGVLGGLGLGLTRAGDHNAGAPATGSPAPTARVQPALAGDDIRQDVVLFGGRGPGGAVLADTWTWDGKAWSAQHPLHSPPPRRAAVMSSDPRGGGVLLYGGIGTDADKLADTWEWDGTDWRQVGPPVEQGPGPRAGALLVEDPVHRHLVLFGGQGASAPRGSTWSWNGTTWTEERPVDAPPDCAGASMAYDDSYRRAVLVTGAGCTAAGAAGATWTWDWHNWTRLSPAASPPPGNGQTMAYDDASQLLVLTVPQAGRGCGLVTWTWDDTGWTLRPGAGSPVGPAAAVRDPATRRPLLLPASGETWLWSGGAWTVVAGVAPPPGSCPTP
ncbi:MAG TPA: hypothetical protein VGL20_08885 [Candidatus Dormibacteraeota bacterium]|jgi:hypothetical protein